jgi:hypothetical protein
MPTPGALSQLSPSALLGVLLILIVLIVALVVVEILYILALRRALGKCSPTSRTMDPGMVWLLIVPVVGQVWNFFVVLNIAKSLGNEFRLRGIPTPDPEPGKMIGLAMSVCGVVALIPKLLPSVAAIALPAALAHLFLWIYYWTKINGYSRMLDWRPATAMPGFPASGPPVAGPGEWPQNPGPDSGPQTPPPEGWPQR